MPRVNGVDGEWEERIAFEGREAERMASLEEVFFTRKRFGKRWQSSGRGGVVRDLGVCERCHYMYCDHSLQVWNKVRS